MRKIIVVAVMLGTMVLAQSSDAKSLDDILKEKGVISDDEYKEAQKSKPVDYKPGKGITLTTSDQKFQTTIGGALQIRYTYLDNENSASTDDSEFRIRNAKLWAVGYAFEKDFTYNFQVNFAGTNSTKFLEYAYLNYKFVDEAQILVGENKVPFNRGWLSPFSALEFIDRSIASDTFRPGYDIGVMPWGKVKKGMFNYNAGIYGGVGQNTLRTTDKAAYVARATFNPLGDMSYNEGDVDNSPKPLLSIGANYWYDTLRATRTGTTTTLETNNLNLLWLNNNLSVFTQTEDLNIDQYGFDAAFKWRGFFAQAEYLDGRAVGNNSSTVLHAYGFYGQAGYFIIPQKLEAALRYSYVDPNRNRSNNLHTETEVVISYFFYKHNLKIQGDYTDIQDESSAGDGDRIRIQAQIVF